jgi:methionyl aminopeptidase
MIIVKTQIEIEKMRRAGEKLARLLDELIPSMIKEGNTGDKLEEFCLKYIENSGGVPTFKGYNGYPYAINLSINEEVIHGFPLKSKIFKSGDIISVDCGITLDGYIADSARTYYVGDLTQREKELIKVTEESLYIGIEKAIKDNKIGDISNAIQTHVEGYGFSIIRDFVGHGVGRKLHESPQIPNYGFSGRGQKIRQNMTFAIEPMVSMGDYELEILEDGWTAVTVDKSKCAHFEHTVLITENGPEILTKLK